MASTPGSPRSPKSPKSADSPKAEGVDKPKALDIGELMVRIDEAVEKAIEDTQDLFVTNVSEQRSVISEARDCINKLVRENEAIQENFMKREREAFALQEVQTEEIFQKKAVIESLEAQLVQRDADIVNLREDLKLDIYAIEDEGKLKRKQLTDEFTKQIDELQSRLNSLRDFMNRQDEVEARMEAAEKEALEARQKMADLAPGYGRKFIEAAKNQVQGVCVKQSQKNKEEFDKKLEEVMKKLREEIEDRIGGRVRQVLGQNEVLLSEIHMHTTGTSELQAQNERVMAENVKLRVDLDLFRQSEILQAKRNRHQSHLIKFNDNKVQNLEKSLRQVIRHYSEERRILQEKHHFVVAELESNNQKLKSMVLQKAKELKKFRHLAQVVVRQRGEVELFLLDSIQLVKNQIYLQNQVQHSRTVDTGGSVTNSSLKSDRESAPTSLPAINSRSPSSWPGAGPWPRYKKPLPYNAMYSGGDRSDYAKARRKTEFLEYLSEEEAATQVNILDELGETHMADQVLPKIDISELSWPDREKVLRYLFKKINTAHQADTVRKPQNFQGCKSDAGRTIV